MQLKSTVKSSSTTSKKRASKKVKNADVKKKFEFEYDPSLESVSSVKIKEKYNLFINGKWVAPKTKKYFGTSTQLLINLLLSWRSLVWAT